MVTETTLSTKKRPGTNGSHNHANGNGTTSYKTRENWPLDFAAAYRRERGPYTIRNAITLLSEEPLELFNGWLVWQPMTNPVERGVAANIQEILSIVARTQGFGRAYPDQMECVMVNEDMYKPDVCLISKERFERQVQPNEPGSEHLILKGSPEFVVEIRSPSNRRTQERKKRKSYFESGAMIIWDVADKKRKIWVYEASNPDKFQEYGENDEISCEALLPGWKRKVADFFNKDLSAEEVVGQAAVEWRAESRAEGKLEGELTGLRKVLLIQAQARFGENLPNNLEARLNRCESAKLVELAALFAIATDLADWLKALPE